MLLPMVTITLPVGHSWPSIHWWMSLSAADQGAWASGLGSLGAVLAALWIAGSQARLVRRTAKHAATRRAVMLAVQGTTYLPALLHEIILARSILSNLHEVTTDQEYASMLRLLYLRSAELLPGLVEYEATPPEVALAFARLSSATTAHNRHLELIRMLDYGPSNIQEFREAMDQRLLDHAQNRLVDLAALLVNFDGAYGKIDYSKRENLADGDLTETDAAKPAG